jgi:UDP-N-acetylmuramate--alanine ligase
LVIITPAVPKTHSEWNYFLERDFQVKKKKEYFCFAVAGTHGKTTTSGILGHRRRADVTFIGIVENYNSNLMRKRQNGVVEG